MVLTLGLDESRVESSELARMYSGLCTSTLVFFEARIKGRDPRRLRAACVKHGIVVLRPTAKALALIRAAARKRVKQLGLSSSHIADFMHILLAKKIRAVFVTADRSACKRARDLGVECIYLPDWWRNIAKDLAGNKPRS